MIYAIPILLLCLGECILAWNACRLKKELSRWQNHVSDFVDITTKFYIEAHSLARKVSLLSKFIHDYCILGDDCDPQEAAKLFNEIMSEAGIKKRGDEQ